MEKVLISACLLGENCKYNGGNNFNEAAAALAERFELVPVCPEVLGGLSVPRPPCERKQLEEGSWCVLSNDPEGLMDVTKAFTRGAAKCLKIARENDINLAVLKSRSPSCGSGEIYDGTFSHTVVSGDGVTAELLKKNGIKIINEYDIQKPQP